MVLVQRVVDGRHLSLAEGVVEHVVDLLRGDAQARGEAELAVRLAQSAIVADPARPGSYVALGDLYAAAGQGEFARSYYDAALQIEPTDVEAQRAIAALSDAKATAANHP